jgi:nucleoid-associated protein YgaU
MAGKHRAPVDNTARRRLVKAGVAVGAGAVPVIAPLHPVDAQAVSDSSWDKLAHCESTGNWGINTGNGFFGGLQFDIGTWNTYKGVLGSGAPDRADHASRAQQIAVAEATLADRVRRFGLEKAWAMTWPACSAKTGIRGELPGARNIPEPAPVPAAAVVPAPVAPAPPPPPPAPAPVSNGEVVHHIVKPGDWLSRLAQHYGECGPDADMATCWHAAYERNKAVIGGNPDHIEPGMDLVFQAPGTSVAVADGAQPMASTYTVQRGDTLSQIAKQFGLPMSDLYNANRDIIGGNPALISTGQVLRLQGSQAPAGQAAAPPVSHAAPFAAPLDSMIVTQAFKGDAHQGVDLRAARGTPGYAVMDCDVVESEPASGFGLWTICRATVDGMVVDFVYGHMDRLLAKVGDHFKAGEQIINTGQNGIVQGPHLHFEVWIGGRYKGHPVDPVGWLRAHGVEF